jgi:hypothetical protein
MLSVSVAAVVSVREPTVWLVTFQTALGAVALLVVAWLIAVVDRLDVTVWMFSAVLFAGAGVVGLIAALRDVVRRAHYDLFHWLGVSTLAAALATPLLAQGVGAWLF